MKQISFSITGVVQGVGFRPFCAKLAKKMGLGGAVSNTSGGVALVLRGPGKTIDDYIKKLEKTKPDLSEIHSIKKLSEEECSETGSFVIGKSVKTDRQRVLIPPDIATCPKCLKELFDPSNRRYRYPFINCTDCGPRFTIVKSLPYDRPKTTMAEFPMCDLCQREYEDVNNRRFHAQPNACPDCGPRVWTDGEKEKGSFDGEAVEECRKGLKDGQIWAIKGLGGFHLACDPFNWEALKKLRDRKKRPDKPLALMAENLEAAKSMALITEQEENLLLSPRRPIVLLKIKEGQVNPLVAPGQKRVGIMLPYTPLHHLLLEGMGALVMTSANPSGQPLISDNDRALKELHSIADGFLLNNRDIHMKVDDSLGAFSGNRFVLLRRGRGYVPNPVEMPFSVPPILAAGAEMKCAFSLTQGNLAFPSQYLGDAKELETLGYYEKALDHFLSLYGIKPRFFAYDMHPLYLTTKLARRKMPCIQGEMPVQHHHAHLAACLAENSVKSPAIGLIMDGTGYGLDGTIWGGEFLVGDMAGFKRVGSFLRAFLPGGDKSVLEPWRYGLSLVMGSMGFDKAMETVRAFLPEKESLARDILLHLDGSPKTSSCGRLFDGASWLLGGPSKISYDAQGAMELEGAFEENPVPGLFKVQDQGFITLDWRPFIKWIVQEKPTMAQGSGAFHLGLAQAFAEICCFIKKDTGINSVALAGGVWQNCQLLDKTAGLLEERGFEVLTHRYLSPGDESVSLGQAAVGGWAWRNL